MKLQTLKPRLSTKPGRVPVMQPGSWRTDSTNSTQRGYGYAWQKARAGYLVSHPFCVYCLRDLNISNSNVADVILICAERGIVAPYANLVDHRIAHRGDQALFWDKSNWQSMCTTHHSGDKQREEA